jgi:hypothetical protein
MTVPSLSLSVSLSKKRFSHRRKADEYFDPDTDPDTDPERNFI